MSKKPIKSSLFRFVTLRSPQLVEDKDTGFVSIPDSPSHDVKAASVYYTAVNGITDEEAKKTALKNASFTPMESRAAIKAVNSDLYTFSSWLMRNKNYVSYKSIADNLSAAYLADDTAPYDDDISLTLADETAIWDNLFYQTINKDSATIREACIQILIANKFIKAFKAYHDLFTGGEGEIVFTEEDENQFIKRANASVVIAKDVLLSNKLDPSETSKELPEATKKFLQEDLTQGLVADRISVYKTALKELEKEEVLYNKKNQEAYDSAMATHKSDVTTALNNAKTVDPGTGEISYPGLELDEFIAPAPLALDFQNASGDLFSKSVGDPSTFLSEETMELLKSSNFSSLDNFSAITGAIRECIEEEEELLFNTASSNKKTVKVGGSVVTLDPLNILGDQPYCYAGMLEKQTKLLTDPLVNIFMNIYTGRDDAYITSATYTLVHDDTLQSIVSSGSELVQNNDQKVVYKFLFGNVELPIGLYTFSGTLNFSNGDAVDFSTSIRHGKKLPDCGNIYNFTFSGCGTVQGGSSDPETNTDVTIPSLKGVQSLGIADFRRVEQEICCYVPGEVSHIENILAREYKEKATRSLVSSEITSEQTRETEIENLTDTTSTERNELQNEVSSVVDQQNSQSYGANASVNGSIGNHFNFSAGTNFSNSSSNASSISNTEAQTYAQEVTERALERVVQKVSSKRTSRVLREFEENNKHGFDNTKGEKHITGVYRWVDKVYKNQIVNYGKRLMYEFSIPEPSRVLKEMLYTKEAAVTSELGLIEPAMPSIPSLLNNGTPLSANELNASNYQSIASRYGAEVPSFPDTTLKLSGAAGSSYSSGGFTPDYGGSGYYTSGTENIAIPEGYEVHEASASISFNYHHGKIENSSYSIHIGGKMYQRQNVGVFSDAENIAFTDLGGIQDELAVAYESYDTGTLAISISATCNLTQKGLQEWQNEAFDAIMAAYYARVNEYNDFQTAQQDIESSDANGQRLKFNPAFNRSIEKRELKRLAIDLLTKSTNISISKDNYVVVDGRPEVNASEDFEKHAAAVKFFEQAFDWEIMAYHLYPYFYGDKKDWKKFIQEREDSDPIFQAFLQSGMARMVVPVRPSFETAVNWYMSTGEIWNGQGLVTDINDELYLSVAEEMMEPVGQPVGEPWETRVPTSLTLVQAKSAYLDEGGLPCDPNCLTPSDTIKETDFVISGGEGSNASSGIGSDTIAEDNNVT